MADYILWYHLSDVQGWQQMPINAPLLRIGRERGNTLILNDSQVSREHAFLRQDGRGVWIVDRHSSNGVIVGGQRIRPGEWKLLPLNENFTIGRATLRVSAVQKATGQTEMSAPPNSPEPPKAPAARSAPQRQTGRAWPALPLLGGLLVIACLCSLGMLLAGWWVMNARLSNERQTSAATPSNPAPTASAPAPTVKSDAAASDAAASVPATLTPITPTATSVIQPTAAAPVVVSDLPLQAGEEVRDAAGVTLSLPEGAISPSLQAHLVASQLGGALLAEIEKAYQVESLAYAVSAPESDGIGRAELRFPAASPQARLGILVDGRYLGELGLAPENGFFVARPALGAPQAASQYPATVQQESATQYLVLTPRQASSAAPAGRFTHTLFASFGRPGVDELFRPTGQGESGASCVAERFTLNHCWRSSDSSVYIFWEDNYPSELKDGIYTAAKQVIQAAAAIMSSYQAKGFRSAAISASRAVDIIVQAGLKDPEYSPRTGNLYLPWRFVSGLSSSENRCTVAHELFHWVEDEEYPMNANFWSGAHAWWLETSAEYATFLYDTACIEKNLSGYGNIATNQNALAFQSAPLIWKFGETARYLQAQQLYVSVCNQPGKNCALTQAQFAQAINDGSFPLDSGGALAGYERAASDTARYLLGVKPLEARTDAFLPAITQKAGKLYGDYATLLSADGVANMDVGWMKDQVKKANGYEASVEAKMQKGGVYPLTISNGVVNVAGLPGVLKIEAGPPFWARLDDQEPTLYAGDQTVLLGAISKKMGIGSVRIGAFASDQPQTFKASFKVIELSGDWLGVNSSGAYGSINCGEVEGMAPGQPIEQFAQGDPALAIVMGNGTFVKDADIQDGSYLVWQGSEAGLKDVRIEANARLLPDKVELTYKIELLKPTQGAAGLLPPGAFIGSSRPGGPKFPLNWQGASLGAAALLAGLALLPTLRTKEKQDRGKRRRWLAALLGAAAAGSFLLAGCMGQAYGTIEGSYTFSKIEVVEPNALGSDPGYNYKLGGGVGTINANLTLALGLDASSQPVEQPCQVGINVKTDAWVGPDGLAQAPAFP